jgi:tetratricopeptide (TPR) repeat protein
MVTFSLYWQTRTFDFINYDDYEYIHNNGVVTNGLSVASVKWAFGPEPCRQMSNWHPITTLSWMLDVSLFGVNSGAMHVHNAFVHSVNGVLLFIFLLMLLKCMEGGREAENEKCKVESEKSFFIFHFSLFPCLAAFIGAAFWAWHPLRAESVAWVSSRKDVLSILFLLPGLMAYLKALKGGGKVWLFVSGVCYLFAYFSKPTAVVYPLLAVMLEYVVTRRISWRQNELLVYLMGILMAVTFIVQDVGGATVKGLSLFFRLENAVAGMGHYIFSTVWPTKLSIFYKYEIPIPLHRFAQGSIFLLVVLWFLKDRLWPRLQAYWKERDAQMPYGGYPVDPSVMMALGLLWFGFSLAPVIGLIQVGSAACADRYTYLSGLGLSIVFSVGVWELRAILLHLNKQYIRSSLFVLFYLFMMALLVIITMTASVYIAQWKNTKTIFDHAIHVTDENYVAYCNLGNCMIVEDRHQQALEYFLESVKYFFAEVERKKIAPTYKDWMTKNLSIAFSALEGGGVDKVAFCVKLKSDVILSTKVKHDDPLAAKKIFAQGLYAYSRELDNLALQYFDEALKLAPSDDYLWRFKGYTLERLGVKEEALVAFKRSYALKPAKDIQKRIKALEQAIIAGDGR